MSPNPTRRRSMINAIGSIFGGGNSSSSPASPLPVIPSGQESSPQAQSQPPSSSGRLVATLRRRSTDHYFSAASSSIVTATPGTTTTNTTTGSSQTRHADGAELERSKSASTATADAAAARQSERESELSAASLDLLFRYQLTQQPDPRRLGPEAFHAAGVAANRAVSARIHAVLRRHNIISSATGDYRIYADRISRSLPGQLPFLQPRELHRMVGMLFHWEQEQSRWNLIGQGIEAEKARFAAEMAPLSPSPAQGENGAGAEAGAEGAEEAPTDEYANGATGGRTNGNIEATDTADAPTMTTTTKPAADTTDNAKAIEAARQAVAADAGRAEAQRADAALARHARLERHRLAVAHLENERRTIPSLRDVLRRQRRRRARREQKVAEGYAVDDDDDDDDDDDGGEEGEEEDGENGQNRLRPTATMASTTTTATIATLPPAYGDFLNSITVMGSPSREDVSTIATTAAGPAT